MKAICPRRDECLKKYKTLFDIHCDIHEFIPSECTLSCHIIPKVFCVPLDLKYYMKEILEKDKE